MNQRLFWITPKWPLPAEDGARRATVHLLKSLADLGAEIHLCAIVPKGESPDTSAAIKQLGVRSVSIVSRSPSNLLQHLKNLLTRPFMPLTVSPYASNYVTKQVMAAMGDSSGSIIVFDGLHAAGWLVHVPSETRNSILKIYRAHNVEADLWTRGASQKTRSRLMKIFLNFQGRLMREFEQTICRESKVVAAVSREDEAGLQKLYGPIVTQNIPIGISLDNFKAAPAFPKKRNLLFIGRLDWQPNRDGLKWFLEQVWPEAIAKSSDLSLTIAGAGDGRWLEAFSGLPRLNILGRVPEVAPLYADACASLVPVFFGSGTRVKAIEASSFARPCISTAIGVEGIGLQESSSYFRAETKDQWLSVLTELSLEDAEKRGSLALNLISQEFDPNRIASKFLSAIKAKDMS